MSFWTFLMEEHLMGALQKRRVIHYVKQWVAILFILLYAPSREVLVSKFFGRAVNKALWRNKHFSLNISRYRINISFFSTTARAQYVVPTVTLFHQVWILKLAWCFFE